MQPHGTDHNAQAINNSLQQRHGPSGEIRAPDLFAIALAGMLIMPDVLFKSFGIGTMVVVVTVVAAALTLLPALLGLLGDRINWLPIPFLNKRRSPESGGGFWGAITGVVTSHPVISVVITAAP